MASLGASTRLYFDECRIMAIDMADMAGDLDFAEIWLCPPFFPKWRSDMMARSLELAGEALDSFGLFCTIHASHHDINPASLNPSVRRCASQEILKVLDAGSALGASSVTFHPGRTDYDRLLSSEALRDWLIAMDGRVGNDAPRLCLENLAGGDGMCQTLDDMEAAVEGLENIWVTLDIAHAHAMGWDPAESVGILGARIGNVHVSALTGGRHVPFTEDRGTLVFLEALSDIGYDGTYVIEGAKDPVTESVGMQAESLKKMLGL